MVRAVHLPARRTVGVVSFCRADRIYQIIYFIVHVRVQVAVRHVVQLSPKAVTSRQFAHPGRCGRLSSRWNQSVEWFSTVLCFAGQHQLMPGTQELQRNICSVRCSHLLDTWRWSSRRRHLWFRFIHNQSKKFTSVTCFPLAAWLVSFGLVRSSLIFSVKVENSCSCCPRKMPKQYFQHLHFVVHWITVVQTHNCSWYVTEQSTVARGVAETIFYLEMCNPMQGVNKHANHETREIIAWKLYKEKRSK